MKVTEQIDALRLSGITPTSYLITPRCVATIFMSYVLTVFAVVVAFSAGGITAWSVFGLNPASFFNSDKVTQSALGSLLKNREDLTTVLTDPARLRQ